MKTAKYIVFTLMCVLLALMIAIGYTVFERTLDLFLPDSPQGDDTVQTPSSSSVPTTPESSIPTGHHCSYTIKGKTYAPTCDAMGYTVYACECGREDWKDYVPALEHIYSEYTVIAPTCTEEGWTERSCSRCNQTERTNFTPAAHQFGTEEETRNYRKLVCDACGYIEQYSTESGPGWKMEISTLEPVGEYTHLQLFLTLNGGEIKRTYNIYTGLPEQIPEFDYLQECLVITYLVGEETQGRALSAKMNVITIHADGNVEMLAPTLPPDTETDPE